MALLTRLTDDVIDLGDDALSPACAALLAVPSVCANTTAINCTNSTNATNLHPDCGPGTKTREEWDGVFWATICSLMTPLTCVWCVPFVIWLTTPQPTTLHIALSHEPLKVEERRLADGRCCSVARQRDVRRALTDARCLRRRRCCLR